MENVALITQLPTTFLGWVTIIVVLSLAVITFLNLKRFNEIKILKSSNETLRTAVADQGLEIAKLKETVKEQQADLDGLKKQREDLRGLILIALQKYFEGNPDTAKKLLQQLT